MCRRLYATPDRWHDKLALTRIDADDGMCGGPKNGRVCSWALAEQLGLADLLPPYTLEQQQAFLARFSPWHMMLTRIAPTPWLSIGRDLRKPRWRVPSWLSANTLGTSAAFFYGNEYIDFALFQRFFSRPVVRNGKYIEIGGSNGVHASNTLFFEQHLNWTGVLIEPTPCGRCALPYVRPRDHVINAGVCRNTSRLDGTYMRGFCPSPQDACVRWFGSGYDRYNVPCQPIHELLPKQLRHVDLFSIDVEDRVMDVLETFPWSRVTVDVVLAECNGARLRRACIEHLTQHGFRVFDKHGFGGDVLAVRDACVSPSSHP